MIKVRPAELYDLFDLSAMWADLVEEEHGNNNHSNFLMWESTVYHSMRNDKNFAIFIAEDNDSPVGFIMGRCYYEPQDSKIHGVSQHIYVKKEYRKQQAGLLLYHNLCKAFIKLGAEIIGFNCILEKVNFWKKKGYLPTQVVMSRDARKLSEAFCGASQDA